MTFIYNEKEMNKIRIIDRLVHNTLTNEDVMQLLSCSERTVRRMKAAYIKYGPPWLIHWLKGKPSNHQGDETKYWYILNILRTHTKYHDFGPTLLKEHLAKDFDITIWKETLRQKMINAWVRVAKTRRKKIKHQQRARRSKYWELVQFDWSYHDWFENWESYCLLCAVDDATSNVYLKFTKWESFEDVFEFWCEYFEKFGKPQAIYLDRHATYKVNSPQDLWDKERVTRFKAWMWKLWVEVIYAYSPEAKWRVEKWNSTHQDRLVKKMRLLDIKTVEGGNKYLKENYIEQHNKKFAIQAREEWDMHEKLTEKEQQEINWYFASTSSRIIKRNWTVQYKNKTYQFPKGLVLKNRRILVKETIYWSVKFFDWLDYLHFTNQT